MAQCASGAAGFVAGKHVLNMKNDTKKPQLDAQEMANKIYRLECALDLTHADWMLDGVNLWPLYRLELFRLFFAISAEGARTRQYKTFIGPTLKQCRHFDDADAPHRFWLVSDGVSFANMGDGSFERCCGPIYQAFQKQNIESVLIDRAGQQPRRMSAMASMPMRWWAPITQRAKLFGVAKALLRPDARHARLIKKIRFAAADINIELPPLSARRFNAMANAVMRLAGILEIKMHREAVKAVFLTSYYDVAGYAYILAAHRVGAVSVDVQHGITGSLHPSYANWQVETQDGLLMLPKLFFSWSDGDANTVNKWAETHYICRREGIATGHPFIQAWQNHQLELAPDLQNLQQQLLTEARGLPIGLVTLQPSLCSRDSLAPLCAAWAHQSDFMWWIRLHPMAVEDESIIAEMLEKHGVKNWNIKAATELPLPAVLSHADFHITHSSSVVLEAEYFGVPSFIVSNYGAQLFADVISRGKAAFTSDGAGLHKAVNGVAKAAMRARNEQKSGSVKNSLDKALARLLEMTR